MNLGAAPIAPPAGWAVSSGLTPYEPAVAAMEARAAAIAAGEAGELVWLLDSEGDREDYADSIIQAAVNALLEQKGMKGE